MRCTNGVRAGALRCRKFNHTENEVMKMAKNGGMQQVVTRVLAAMLVASFLLAVMGLVWPTSVAAWPCWYEEDVGGCVTPWSNCNSGWGAKHVRRQCCYRGGATVGCGGWYTIGIFCCY